MIPFTSTAFRFPDLDAPSAWIEHVPFMFWLVDAFRPHRFVELGTHTGVSYCAACQAIELLRLPCSCYAIDTWKGDEHAGFYDERVYTDLAAYHAPKYAAFSSLVRSTFDAAVDHFEDESIDLLHIDGLHTYDAVRHDFENWRPKLTRNAIVLFHDTNVHERDFGVYRLWGEVSAGRPHFEFLHGHGLGVLGIGDSYPKAVEALFAAGEQDHGREAVRTAFAHLGQAVAQRGNTADAARQAETKLALSRSEWPRYQDMIQEDMATKGIYLDVDFYRNSYADLAHMSDEHLRDHFAKHGAQEGRLGTRMSLREHFLDEVRSNRSILEIGPFCNPQVTGGNVRYFDVLDSQQLVARAEQIGYPIKAVPQIHYTSPIGNLSVVPDRFAAAISCHCIEHQPDLIHHLQQVANILDDGGRYYVIIPDKRYCFDRFIPESTIADFLDAHFSQRRTHSLASVIEHRALTVHNDCVRHWQGDHGTPLQSPEIVNRVRDAIEEYKQAHGGYVDVHAWQFTPEGFQRDIQALYELGYSPLRPLRVHGTSHNRNEFTAILSR